MQIKRRMAQDFQSINPGANVLDALNLLHKHAVSHLPVLDGEQFVGFVSESDLRQVLLLPGGKEIRIEEIMNRTPVTIGPEENLEEAAKLIYTYKLDALPVLDGSHLVGIITVSDILAAFIELMGALQASSRIDVRLQADSDAFDEVARIIRSEGGEIINVGMGNAPGSNERFCFFRLKKCAVEPIAEAVQQHGFEVVSVIE